MRNHSTLGQFAIIGTVAILFLLIGFGGIGSVARVQMPAPIQPLLMQMARANPDARISVIIQKQSTGADLVDLIQQLDGNVTAQFTIINALVAELPARAVLELAKSNSVRRVTLNASVVPTGCIAPCIDTTNLVSRYPQTVRASRVWNMNQRYLQGQGIAVAVVDSGINANHPDLQDQNNRSRIIASAKINRRATSADDQFGHGTHVAGIIGGNGKASRGTYIGIAPKVNLVNVKISDDLGAATEADLIAGLEWIYHHRKEYNIRVISLSVTSSVDESYHTSPIDAACEVLWFNRVVVVVASGNLGKNALYPPANDPFVLTVGATAENGTIDPKDDRLAVYSTYGWTIDRISKPDIVAPGNNLISLLASSKSILAKTHPDHLVSGFTGSSQYFRMSGTSMSAPIVAGATALLLQANPHLTPDQVKYRLKYSALPLPSANTTGAGELDVYAAVTGTSTASLNTNIAISRFLTTNNSTLQWTSLNWDSLNWDSLNWDSLNWDSLNWDSLNWDSLNWDSDYWLDPDSLISAPAPGSNANFRR